MSEIDRHPAETLQVRRRERFCGSGRPSLRSPRLTGRLLLRLGVLAALAIVASGIGHILNRPTRDQSPGAAMLVVSLRDGLATLDLVPEDFQDELGYWPIAGIETLANPNGGCSTPGGVGPKIFNDACRTHDLGYDTLRYAETSGSRLGPWARLDLDRRLLDDLIRSCENPTCRTTAAIYYAGVTANSIRQGYTAPSEEPTLPWAGLGLALVAIASIWSALVDGWAPWSRRGLPADLLDPRIVRHGRATASRRLWKTESLPSASPKPMPFRTRPSSPSRAVRHHIRTAGNEARQRDRESLIPERGVRPLQNAQRPEGSFGPINPMLSGLSHPVS